MKGEIFLKIAKRCEKTSTAEGSSFVKKRLEYTRDNTLAGNSFFDKIKPIRPVKKDAPKKLTVPFKVKVGSINGGAI